MKRCLHIIDHIEAGGAQKIVAAFLENDIVFALRQGEYSSITAHKNLYVHASKRKYSISPMAEIKALIKAEEIECLVSHLPRSHYFGQLIKKQMPELFLLHYEHGDVYEKSSLIKYLIRKSIKRSDKIVAVSEATKKRLIALDKSAAKKTTVIRNFVDDAFFNIKEKAVGEELQLGFVARIIERKGWKTLLEAAALLKDLPFTLYMAGTGAETDACKERIHSLSLDKKVVMEDYIEDIAGFYAKIDILIIPSDWEPLGIIALEAMASGRAIIASNVDGMNELLQDERNALLFEAGDALWLASQIQRLAKDKDLRKSLIEEARKDALGFKKEDFIRDFRSIIEEI